MTVSQDVIDEEKGNSVSAELIENTSPEDYELVVTNPVPRMLSVNIKTTEVVPYIDGYCPSWSSD